RRLRQLHEKRLGWIHIEAASPIGLAGNGAETEHGAGDVARIPPQQYQRERHSYLQQGVEIALAEHMARLDINRARQACDRRQLDMPKKTPREHGVAVRSVHQRVETRVRLMGRGDALNCVKE